MTANGHVAVFKDKYGDDREIHKTRHGLRVKRIDQTPILAMNPHIAALIGARIRDLRIDQGLSLKELAERTGMNSGNPKERVWAIENATRGEGMRLGTLYAFAMALGVEAAELLPTNAEVAKAAGVRGVSVPAIGLS